MVAFDETDESVISSANLNPETGIVTFTVSDDEASFIKNILFVQNSFGIDWDNNRNITLGVAAVNEIIRYCFSAELDEITVNGDKMSERGLLADKLLEKLATATAPTP